MDQAPISDVTHVIQLSVAPVFLLTSVGTILGVLSTRLGRIVDRARVLGDRAATASGEQAERLRAEQRLLVRRRHLVNIAIGAGVTAALFVCVLIACAFVGSLFHVHVGRLLAVLFIAAMAALVTTLLTFLAEVVHASTSLRIGPE